MFPVNTILAWIINIYHDYKEINNNFIIASRAYFLQPIPVKRLARLTWSKGGGPAHGKPVNGLFAYSPFTAANPAPIYGLSELGPVASSGPSNIIAARFNFRPMYGPWRLSAHMRPYVTLGLLMARGETGP